MNALDAIRVLGLSRVLAGPWCTQTPPDLGPAPLLGRHTREVPTEVPGWGEDRVAEQRAKEFI